MIKKNSFFTKALSVGVSASLMLAMVPFGWQDFLVEAANPIQIPQKMFATSNNLKDKNMFNLETTDDNKMVQINFGKRPNDVKYDGVSEPYNKTAKAGPMTWLVAGYDQGNTSNNGGLVLYAKEPMVSSKYYDDSSNSLFQTSQNGQTYIPENTDSGYNSTDSQAVLSNHWGASNLRTQAQNLLTTYFKTKEQSLIEPSKIKTIDVKNNLEYITTDKLYAPRLKPDTLAYPDNTEITVGEDDDIKINKAHWNSCFWLRSPHSTHEEGGRPRPYCECALNIDTGNNVNYSEVDTPQPAQLFAFKLDLSNVLFASAAKYNSSTENLSTISSNTPMTLRLNGDSEISSNSSVTFSSNSDNVTYTANTDERLVILATKSDGTTYQYVTAGDGNQKTLNISQLGLPHVTAFAAKAWIEKDVEDGSQLTYAKNLIDFTFTTPRRTPAAGDFTFNTQDSIYNSTPKVANVIDTKNDAGNITYKYYQKDNKTQPAVVGSEATTAPTNVGKYKVKIDVAGSSTCFPASDLTADDWTFEITEATPTYTAPNLSETEANYGSTLDQVYSDTELKTLLGSPQFDDKTAIPGAWSWADGKDSSTGDLGSNTFKANFTPNNGIKDNCIWTNISNWDETSGSISVDVPVKVVQLPIGKDAKIILSSTSFTYDGSEQKPTVTVQKDNSTTLTEGTDYNISWPKDATNAGSKDIIINFKGNYIGQTTTKYTINPAVITVTADNQTKIVGETDPELTYTIDPNTPLVTGDTLSGTLSRTAGEAIGTYDITQGTLANANYNITFNKGTFTINKKLNPENWGDKETHGDIIHYVDASGTTSVEISPENTDKNNTIWLREESDGSSSWYGLNNSSGIFQNGSRFYVQWLSEKEHPEAFKNIDKKTRAEVEDDNGWLFNVGVIAPDGTQYKQLEKTVDFYVQIGDDWDKEDLKGFYISQGVDESIPVRYSTANYPEGTDEFGIMSLSHFSPYFIYDQLTAAERNAKTGDIVSYLTISGLCVVMTLALGLMINSKVNKKKFDK